MERLMSRDILGNKTDNQWFWNIRSQDAPKTVTGELKWILPRKKFGKIKRKNKKNR